MEISPLTLLTMQGSLRWPAPLSRPVERGGPTQKHTYKCKCIPTHLSYKAATALCAHRGNRQRFISTLDLCPLAGRSLRFARPARHELCCPSCTFLLVWFTTAACLVRSFMADHGGMTNSFITQRLQRVGWDHWCLPPSLFSLSATLSLALFLIVAPAVTP